MKIVTQLIYTVILFACLSPQLNADVSLAFSTDNGGSFSNEANVLAGDLVKVTVFLAESTPDTVLATDGLLGFGLTGFATLSGSGTITAASHSSEFDFSSTDSFSTSMLDWEALVLNNAVPTGSNIVLGSFDFQTVADGSTAIEFGDIQPGSTSAEANWLSGAGSELDEVIFGTGATDTFQFRINVSSVPEPSSAAVILLGSFLLAFGRRRKT